MAMPFLTRSDPRLQVGAYIKSGGELFEVISVQEVTSNNEKTKRYVLENCKSLKRVPYLQREIEDGFELVRKASDTCPDAPPDFRDAA